MSCPGAITSGLIAKSGCAAPRDENPAIESSLVVAPTVIALRAQPGESIVM
jgi:hypothetical protein